MIIIHVVGGKKSVKPARRPRPSGPRSNSGWGRADDGGGFSVYSFGQAVDQLRERSAERLQDLRIGHRKPHICAPRFSVRLDPPRAGRRSSITVATRGGGERLDQLQTRRQERCPAVGGRLSVLECPRSSCG